MDKMRFLADNRELRIREIEDDYCIVSIIKDEKETVLGSEMFSIIKDNFISSLENISSQKLKEFRGISVFHIMNLGEPHATIMGSPQNEGVDIYWIDKDGKCFRILKLDSADLQRLITALKNYDHMEEL